MKGTGRQEESHHPVSASIHTLAIDATIAVPAGASIDPLESKAEAPNITLVASLIVTAAPDSGV